MNAGVWSDEEHGRFLVAMADCQRSGNFKWKEVSERVGTRSPGQCRSHDQKLKQKQRNRDSGRGRPTRSEHLLPGDLGKVVQHVQPNMTRAVAAYVVDAHRYWRVDAS
jgi:hypothetical protein